MSESGALPQSELVEYVEGCVERGDLEFAFGACKKATAEIGFPDGKNAAIQGIAKWAALEMAELDGTADVTEKPRLEKTVLNLAARIARHTNISGVDSSERQKNLAPVLPPTSSIAKNW